MLINMFISHVTTFLIISITIFYSMEFLYIPTYLKLFKGEKDLVEICEKILENLSGETLHTFKFHQSRLNDSNNFTETEIQDIYKDINDCHIAIREVGGGVHVVTSLRFCNAKLKDYTSSVLEFDIVNSYYIFFVRAMLYLVNYYYFVKKEKIIHIEKSSFQVLLGFHSQQSGKFNKAFERFEKELITIGLINYLFIYNQAAGLNHYVLNTTAFLSLFGSNKITAETKFPELKVLINYNIFITIIIIH